MKTKHRTIGRDQKTYFIADIAANHDGSLDRALELIRLAAEAGVDAAKFQNFQADKIVSQRGFDTLGGKIAHQSKWEKSVFEVYQDAAISMDWTPRLKAECDRYGIDYFTSPYDFESIDHVDPYVELYKIGSGDITWLEIVDYIASKNKPVMIAAGASTLDDVKRAMDVLLKRTDKVVLMQCNTNYTGDLKNFAYINLNVLKTFQGLYPNVLMGLSDHTPGHATVLGAVALGARVVEKHFTDDNDRKGPDHPFSMNPKSWREMVDRVRELELAMGDGIKRVEPNEQDACVVQRRCLRVTQELKAGDVLSKENVFPTRPCPEDGLPPYEIENVLGKKLTKPLAKGGHITKGHLT